MIIINKFVGLFLLSWVNIAWSMSRAQFQHIEATKMIMMQMRLLMLRWLMLSTKTNFIFSSKLNWVFGFLVSNCVNTWHMKPSVLFLVRTCVLCVFFFSYLIIADLMEALKITVFSIWLMSMIIFCHDRDLSHEFFANWL